MEDWEPRLADLDRRLVEWNRLVEAELAKLKKERRLGGLLRRPSPQDLEAAAVEARRRAGTAILDEAVRLFDAMCDLYLVSLPQERAKIRARIGMHDNVWDLFWPYVDSGPDRVRRRSDEPELVRALAALSIEDARRDLELTDDVAGRLAVAGAGAGIDWRAAFAKVAAVSNTSTSGGASRMRELLEGFERSKAFATRFAAEVRAAEKRAALLEPPRAAAG